MKYSVTFSELAPHELSAVLAAAGVSNAGTGGAAPSAPAAPAAPSAPAAPAAPAAPTPPAPPAAAAGLSISEVQKNMTAFSEKFGGAAAVAKAFDDHGFPRGLPKLTPEQLKTFNDYLVASIG